MKSILLLFFPLICMATPAQVVLMRHAEKPIEGEVLSLKGRERTMALIPFFYGNPMVLSHGLPVAIYASKSLPRTELTIKPLAEKLVLSIKDRFATEQVETLTKEILTNPDYEGKMVVICWSHREMPQIASLLGVKKPPKKWPEKIYDRLWVVSYDEEGQASFKDLPQKLLYGDSSR